MAFRGFTGNLNKRAPTGVNRPNITYTPPRKSSFDPSGFDSAKDRSKPPQLTPARGVSAPSSSSSYTSPKINIDEIIANASKSSNRSQGINAFNNFGGGQSGSNMNRAQAVLGPAYNQAIGMGYSPTELINSLSNAQGYNRGVDVNRFKEKLNLYDAFQNKKGDLLQYDGKTYGNVLRPQITANAPTTGQFFGDMAGGVSNLLGAAGEFITGGGMLGNVIDAVKQKFSQGKDFVQSAFNPGDINQRVNALSPEQQRVYAMYMNQGMPYQQAFQMATGQNFAMGGIASLN